MNKLLSTALIAVLGIIVYDYHKQADAYKLAVTYLTPIDDDEPDPNLTLYDYLYVNGGMNDGTQLHGL